MLVEKPLDITTERADALISECGRATQTGEQWFMHFQDKGAYSRVVHLQPMRWIADWPGIGTDPDGDGIGEPVLTYKKPNVGRSWPPVTTVTPPDSDEFAGNGLGLQWQWHASSAVGATLGCRTQLLWG